jgi:hypothetical protein
MEDKVYQVREYQVFPHPRSDDKIVKEFKRPQDAYFYSIGINRKKKDERYYVIDNPHEYVELSESQRQILKDKYGLE